MKNADVFYESVSFVAPPVLKAVWRPRVVGLQNVPRTGGVILASNHLSFVDSVVIPSVVPRKVVFLAKSDYFTGTGVKGTLTRAWFEGMGMLPIDRGNTGAAMASLETAREVLSNGEAFGIYPEGTRSRDGLLYRGRTGVAELALSVRVPIVPVGLRGTQNIQPVGSSRPRLAKVEVAFGKPIQIAGEYDEMPRGRARRDLTDRLMRDIGVLSGQEHAGVYNELPADA